MKEENITIAKLTLTEIALRPSQVHKLRGFIGDLFREEDIIHNHDTQTGKPIYRYPMIQFKVFDRMPLIVAIQEQGINAFKKIFFELKEIKIEDTVIPVNEKELEVNTTQFGIADDMITYRFVSPWIGLNQNNYRKYVGCPVETPTFVETPCHGVSTGNGISTADKQHILRQCLIGNIISMSKYLGYRVPERIEADLNVKPVTVNLKGESFIGFTGYFKCNFLIPDLVGLGKSVSRGFGTVEKVI